MKKQAKTSFSGKTLSRTEMKKLKGGTAPEGLWVCTADWYTCYFFRGQCEAACSDPSACRYADYCP